mmetsp:Transcript_87807/g.283564  ORF Transcript_87807/g.283564 Transcript_87807/m.283564 type:complete len:278 (+) Transcript_87807:2367-3200(+)
MAQLLAGLGARLRSTTVNCRLLLLSHREGSPQITKCRLLTSSLLNDEASCLHFRPHHIGPLSLSNGSLHLGDVARICNGLLDLLEDSPLVLLCHKSLSRLLKVARRHAELFGYADCFPQSLHRGCEHRLLQLHQHLRPLLLLPRTLGGDLGGAPQLLLRPRQGQLDLLELRYIDRLLHLRARLAQSGLHQAQSLQRRLRRHLCRCYLLGSLGGPRVFRGGAGSLALVAGIPGISAVPAVSRARPSHITLPGSGSPSPVPSIPTVGRHWALSMNMLEP